MPRAPAAQGCTGCGAGGAPRPAQGGKAVTGTRPPRCRRQAEAKRRQNTRARPRQRRSRPSTARAGTGARGVLCRAAEASAAAGRCRRPERSAGPAHGTRHALLSYAWRGTCRRWGGGPTAAAMPERTQRGSEAEERRERAQIAYALSRPQVLARRESAHGCVPACAGRHGCQGDPSPPGLCECAAAPSLHICIAHAMRPETATAPQERSRWREARACGRG